MHLRIHNFLPQSFANGPGCRAAIWTQGCSLGCPGCFNRATHPGERGKVVSVDELFDRIAAVHSQVQGLTVSGGEPFQQLRPLTFLLQRVRSETQLSIIVLTGYAWSEIVRLGRDRSAADSENKQAVLTNPAPAPEVLQYIDVLIAGRYRQQERIAHGLRGSANKTVHLLTNRYSMSDLDQIPSAEVLISATGTTVMSGVDPLRSMLHR